MGQSTENKEMRGKSVSLALGSGGARGFAHIGVIEVLQEKGFEIRNVSGSSMGASVGGMFCAGKMEVFKDFILKLNKRETFRLMDFTMSTQGVIKGQKIVETLKTMLGEIRIEDFDMPYTAVATDVNTKEEVWMRSGDLFNVMRASSSIPSLMKPVRLGKRLLIDGGVLNPLPIEPLLPKNTDLIIAVNINAYPENHTRWKEIAKEVIEDISEGPSDEETKAYTTRMVKSVKGWLNMNSSTNKPDSVQENTLSYFGMLNKTLDFMQDRMCEQTIIIHKPDIVINIPRHLGTTLEFYRAKEMIEEGRSAVNEQLPYGKNKILSPYDSRHYHHYRLVSVAAFQNRDLMAKLQFNAYLMKHSKQWHRVISHAFVHSGWMHLLINMWVLYLFGSSTESFFEAYRGSISGPLIFVALYLGGILFSSLSAFRKHQDNFNYNAVGASGAVSAVLFSAIYFTPTMNLYLMFIPIPIPAVIFGVGYLILEWYLNKKSNDFVAHDAHFWGAAFGFVFSILMVPEQVGNFLGDIIDRFF